MPTVLVNERERERERERRRECGGWVKLRLEEILNEQTDLMMRDGWIMGE